MRAFFFAAVASVIGCGPQQLAPYPDYVEPELRVEEDSLWQPAGMTIVEGTARHVTEVAVNGVSAQVDGERFVAQVNLERGVNVLEARGLDGRGDALFVRQGVLAGDFRNPDQPIAGALAMRLNRGGIQKAADLVSGMVQPSLVTGSLAAINPVYSDSYGLFGWNAVEFDASLLNVQFSPPLITPDPRTGLISLQIVLPNVEVHIGVDGTLVGFGFSQEAWIGADAAVVNAYATLSATNGRLEVEAVTQTVSLNGFWYDTTLLPGDIEDWLFVDTVRGAVEDMLLEQLQTMLPGMLESALADLDISFQTELLGKQVSLGATFASASVDAAGVQLGADLTVQVAGNEGRPWVGYLGAPQAPARPPLLDDLGLAVSDDLLNNVFFQAWRSGMLSLDLDSARGELEPVLLTQLGATNAARVVVDATLPPVVVERDGRLQAQITELLVRVETPGGTRGEFLDLSATMKVDVEMVVRQGVLRIALGTPAITLDVRDSDWGASNNAITNLLAQELPIGMLLLMIGNLEFPLPSLAGITIGDADAQRDSSGVYTSVGVNF